MNQQENAGACENRFAARLTRMIAAGALVASMAPVVAYADGSSSAAEANSTSIEATPPLEGFTGAGDSVVAVAAAAADSVSAMAVRIADTGVGAVGSAAGDASADEAGSVDASVTEVSSVDASATAVDAAGGASAVAAKAAGSARVVAATAVVDGDDTGISATATEGTVAMIGENEYDSLDAAVKDAADGDTIEVLQDCTTEGLNLSKGLTIKGADGATPTIAFARGIALWGKALVLKNCNVAMNGVGSTPYSEWSWMAICASKNASLTLDHATMTMDGTNAGNAHAIYFCSNNKLNLVNGSVLTIKNYKQDALEWDGGDGGYNVNITNSTFISDHNRSGFTGTFYATIDNSTVNVINSTGNGSNGSHFIIENKSKVDFSNNGSHGLSTGILKVSDSTITANNNGLTGVIFNNKATFANSTVSISGTKGTSYWNAGMRAYTANASCAIDKDTTINIADNLVTGIFLDANTSLTIEEGANVLVTRNHAEQANCSTKKDLAQMGGGIVVRAGASAALSSTTRIYNNHAALAGDDIYLEGAGSKLTLYKVGSKWSLDGGPDCDGKIHSIDGWYDDSEEVENADSNNASEGGTVSEGGDSAEGGNSQEGTASERGRWQAHAGVKGNHVVLINMADAVDGAITLESSEGEPVALKAAHGVYAVAYKFVSGTEGMELPEGVTSRLPTDGEQHEIGAVVAAQQPEKTTVKVEGGTWTFEGYDANEKTVDGDLTFVGTWVYAADPIVPADPDVPDAPSAPQDQDAAVIRPQEDSVVLAKTGDDTMGVAASAAIAAAAAGASLLALGSRARRRS